jgi:hypothetical protein
VTIAIAYPGASYPPINATVQCTGGVCSASATTSLPVEPNPYTFSIVDYGTGGPNDQLASGSTQQVLSPGPNAISLTLGGIVKSMSLSITGGTPTPGAPGLPTQVFPVTFTAFDADGNPITGTAPYASVFTVAYREVDALGAFNLQKGPTGSVTCSVSNQSCNVTANTDTLEVTYNPSANGFSTYPAYYPSEFVIYDFTAATLNANNSADIATAPCTSPQPICLLAAPYYSGLLAAGGNINNYGGFSPTILAVNGSTVWSDVGVISAAQAKPTYTVYPSLGTVEIGALQYTSATNTTFAPDYEDSGSGNLPNQLLLSFSPSGNFTTSTYPDTTYANGAPSGAGVIVGPDGNVWWIDPLTSVLQYANPATPGTVTTCLLQPSTPPQVFLTAAQIVATPPGVTPSRIWFSAVDNEGGSTGGNYLGYVNVSPGSNSCGAGQTGHYKAFDGVDFGSPTPPNGLAVDGSGNAWYNDGDSNRLTNVGEATINPGTGAVTVSPSVSLPSVFISGNDGADQAWGIVYNQLDHNLYFAADNGLIGRFAPSAGVGSATAYALPGPVIIGGLPDEVSGPSNYGNPDEPCSNFIPSSVPGPCGPQFLWDPGAGGSGRLTFSIYGLNNTIPSLTGEGPNVVAQLNLSGGIVFSTSARGRHAARRSRSSNSRRPPAQVRIPSRLFGNLP